jgi:hypothetical protein
MPNYAQFAQLIASTDSVFAQLKESFKQGTVGLIEQLASIPSF